jgi:predicted metal-binding membrane protein
VTSGIAFAAAVKRDRAVVLTAIVFLIALAWAYTAHVAWKAAPMSGSMAMPNMMQWGAADFGFMFIMWTVMMVAMMLPSATPMILLFGRVREKREFVGRPYAPTAAFVSGYLLVWCGFSLFATILNWGLHVGGALSSMMGHSPPIVGGVLLIAAGIFQWTPLKHVCLDHCRSPIGFLMANWREGTLGATKMGLHHGAYCLGCCWILMVLLFVLGVMNLPWVAVLTVVVLAEKILPRGEILSRFLGVFLILWGGWLIVAVQSGAL